LVRLRVRHHAAREDLQPRPGDDQPADQRDRQHRLRDDDHARAARPGGVRLPGPDERPAAGGCGGGVVTGEAAVVLNDVVKRFGGVPAGAGVSLDVAAGEFVSFIGPSGCGKTTTLRLIAGLETPTSGDIYIEGVRVNDAKPWHRDTPLVWQNFALFPYLNVAKNVEFG